MPQLKSKTTRDRRLTEALTHRDGAGRRHRRHRPALAAGQREGRPRPSMGRRGGLSAARRRYAVGRPEPRPPPPSRPSAFPPPASGPPRAQRCRPCPQRTQRGMCGGRGHGGEIRHIRRASVLALAISRDTAGRRRSSPRPYQVLRTRRAELPAVREHRAPPARPRTHARVRQPCPHTRGGSARSSARCVTAPTRARPPPRPARSARSPRGGKCHPGRAGGRGCRCSSVFIKQHSFIRALRFSRE